MRELVAASTTRTLAVVGFGEYTVPPPPVRAALIVLSLGDPEDDTEGDAEALAEVCADWLPLDTYSVLFSDAFTPKRRRKVLETFLRKGIPERIKDRLRKEREKAVPDDTDAENTEAQRSAYWQARIAQYRSHFGLTWSEVMAEPFFSFIAQLGELHLVESREKRRMADAGIVAFGGDEEGYESMVQASRFPGHDEMDADDVPEGMEWTKDAQEKKKYVQEKLAKVAAIKNRQDHRGPNDL